MPLTSIIIHLEAGADMVIAALTQFVHSTAYDDGHSYQLAAAEDVLDLGGELDRPNHIQIMTISSDETMKCSLTSN